MLKYSWHPYKPINVSRYEIRNAGVQNKVLQEEKFDGATFEVTTGDYSQLLALVADNLESAVVRKSKFKIEFLPFSKWEIEGLYGYFNLKFYRNTPRTRTRSRC